MRVSADRDHPDYKPDFPDYNVSFNGELLSGCVFADSDNDVVKCYVENAKGDYVLGVDSLVTELLHGDVVIHYRGVSYGQTAVAHEEFLAGMKRVMR